ncbi:MAG: hypothetical protein ACLVLH_26740 [Eisenbergiella massiliensis]
MRIIIETERLLKLCIGGIVGRTGEGRFHQSFEAKELGGKYVLGVEKPPNIIFQKDEGRDSGFAITGIN